MFHLGTVHPHLNDFYLHLQYKNVKISAEEILANTREWLLPNETLYIATDEKNKSFFAPLAAHHALYFLDDYFALARLEELDPNFYGAMQIPRQKWKVRRWSHGLKR